MDPFSGEAELIEYMHQSYLEDTTRVLCFIYLRQQADVDPCFDVYIWDELLETMYHRFQISTDNKMGVQEELLYLSYTETKYLQIESDSIRRLADFCRNNRTHRLMYRDPQNILLYLYYEYNCNLRLYRRLNQLHLHYLSLHLHEIRAGIAQLDLTENGICHKMLRLMDNPYGIQILAADDFDGSMLIAVYNEYYMQMIPSIYINAFQWEYLCKCYTGESVFERCAYLYLRKMEEEAHFRLYLKYLHLWEKNRKYYAFSPTPDEGSLENACRDIENFTDIVHKSEEYDKRMADSMAGSALHYEDARYEVVTLDNTLNIIREANYLRNDWWQEIPLISYGNRKLLSVRKKETPDKPYMMLYMHSNIILRAYKRNDDRLLKQDTHLLQECAYHLDVDVQLHDALGDEISDHTLKVREITTDAVVFEIPRDYMRLGKYDPVIVPDAESRCLRIRLDYFSDEGDKADTIRIPLVALREVGLDVETDILYMDCDEDYYITSEGLER